MTDFVSDSISHGQTRKYLPLATSSRTIDFRSRTTARLATSACSAQTFQSRVMVATA